MYRELLRDALDDDPDIAEIGDCGRVREVVRIELQWMASSSNRAIWFAIRA